jgi:hypothetical protein
MSGLLGSRSSKCWFKTAKVKIRSNRLLSKEIKGEGVQGIELKGEGLLGVEIWEEGLLGYK